MWEALAIETQLRKSVHSISESERPEGKQNMHFQAEGQHARQAHFKHRILYVLIFYAASSATNKITMYSKSKAIVSKTSLLEASESPCYLQSVCNCFLWPSLPVFKSGKGYTYLSLFKKGEKEDLRNQSFTRLILRSIQILEKLSNELTSNLSLSSDGRADLTGKREGARYGSLNSKILTVKV